MQPEKDNPTYRVDECKHCRGMGVTADQDRYIFWRRYYKGALRRASQGACPDVELFHAAHRRMAKILTGYPACPGCRGEGGIKRIVEEVRAEETTLRSFFKDGGDGWLTFDEDEAARQ